MESLLIIKEEEANINTVGNKALYLFKYNLVTPDFLVLSTEYYKDWKKNKLRYFSKTVPIIQSIENHFNELNAKKIILRSSATNEKITDRGKYLSSICRNSTEQITKVVESIYNDFESHNSSLNDKVAIIIQVYKKPKIQGHLSNERRVTKDPLKWINEPETSPETTLKPEWLSVQSKLNEFDFSINSCLNVSTLRTNLLSVAAWFSTFDNRFHIEWLWDGEKLWIVQFDQEAPPPQDSSAPGSEWHPDQSKIVQEKSKNFEVFETIETANKSWHKIDCVRTFEKLGLPFWQVYILENETVLSELSRGIVNISLETDIRWLLRDPILIRMDTMNEVMLPRTETVFEYDDAIQFLIHNSKSILKQGIKFEQFCFIIHRFIVSRAGALAFAKPNIDRVAIDSTWGIVDGLYYYPHDSFEYNIRNNSVNEKIRCKENYIDVDIRGNWFCKQAGSNFDWKKSLTKRQIAEISSITQKLSDHFNKPITVMFFINDGRTYPEILPWFYSTDDIPESTTNYTELVFSEKKTLIESKRDFHNLAKRKESESFKKRILLKLSVDIIRDKKFIEDIGDFASKYDYVVDLEGSILSHPYYVLKSKGVDVRCTNPLSFTYGQKEFYKLVRDKIPVVIERNHETVTSTKVTSYELLTLLKEKAVEEALELYWSKNNDEIIEELTDLLEVIIGACQAYGIQFKDIEDSASHKRTKRGGFRDGIVLIATEENSLFHLQKNSDQLFEVTKDLSDARLKPIIQFFRKGKIKNFKSLTEVDKIHIGYINNYASKSNYFRYPLKKEDYDFIKIEYREKDIVITLERHDPEAFDDKSQYKLFE